MSPLLYQLSYRPGIQVYRFEMRFLPANARHPGSNGIERAASATRRAGSSVRFAMKIG